MVEPPSPMPAMPYTPRPCPLWRIGEVIRLHRRCFRIPYHWSVHLYHWLCDPQSYQIVGQAGELAAFCIARAMRLEDGQQVGEIIAIGVAAEQRRRGIARCLLHQAIQRLQRMGLSEIHLQVRASNTGAQRLYQGLGFQVARLLPSYYADGEDAYLMIRQVSQSEHQGLTW